MLGLQYIRNLHRIQSIEGMNIYNPFGNYQYPMPFYPNHYPYYNYWNQNPFFSQHSPYHTNSSPFLPISESYEPIPNHSLSSASAYDSASQPQEQPLKTPYLITRSKASKQSYFVEKIEKLPSKVSTQQKQNRNVYSNILRNFFRKVNDYTKIEDLIQQIITRRGLKLTKGEFIDYIKRIKVNHGKYLRFKKLRNIFMNQNLKQHSTVFRILLQYFTKGELMVQTLTSRKIGKWSVILHLRGTRQLKQKLYH